MLDIALPPAHQVSTRDCHRLTLDVVCFREKKVRVLGSMLDIALHLAHHVSTGDCHRSKCLWQWRGNAKPHHVTCLLWWTWLGFISAYISDDRLVRLWL